MSYNIRLITSKSYIGNEERVKAIAEYRQKFNNSGIDHTFMNLHNVYNVCIRLKSEEDRNFVMLTNPGEFVEYDMNKLHIKYWPYTKKWSYSVQLMTGPTGQIFTLNKNSI